MAVIFYANGILEEFKPKENFFTEGELIKVFDSYDKIRSLRLVEIPNAWCIWGDMKGNPIENDYNKLASYMLGSEIFSHIVILHDTEINIEWKITDDIIYKGYDEFSIEIRSFINDIAKELLNEQEMIRDKDKSNQDMIFLTTVTHTKDKKILFEFDPFMQPDKFYGSISFNNFCNNIYNYLVKDFKLSKQFVIYGDNKMIITIKDENVKKLLDDMQGMFQKKENYEACAFLKNIYERWLKFVNENDNQHVNSSTISSTAYHKKRRKNTDKDAV